MNFASNLPTSKITVTYEGADIRPENTHSPSPIKKLTNKDFILYVGTAHAHKNLKLLIEAFAILKDEHPTLHLALAGNQDDIYRKFIDQTLSITPPDTHFLGYVTDNELAWLYQNASLYAFPSLSEGFGLPGLEAMNSGVPVASSSATCLPEIYGDAAAYFSPHSAQNAAKTINQILTDKTLRNRLIQKGYAQTKRYSWKKMAEQTLEIYKKSGG